VQHFERLGGALDARIAALDFGRLLAAVDAIQDGGMSSSFARALEEILFQRLIGRQRFHFLPPSFVSFVDPRL